jgi:dolichyl-phosphate beta-glucosyltransferase
MFLSIVIPAYNEETRLKTTLKRIYTYLNSKDYNYEVIVVDDGSKDKTKDIVSDSSLSRVGRLRLLQNDKNRGKGFSVKRGILASQGDYILFSDADLSCPIEEFEKLFSYLKSSYDIAIGSRSIKGTDVRVHQPFYREYMGKFFNILVQLFIFKGIIDTQCGFKLFKANVAKDIASQIKINGFAFDVEMLYLAMNKGYKIKEVPVVWINSPISRVELFVDSFRMFGELLSIKRLHNEGKL